MDMLVLFSIPLVLLVGLAVWLVRSTRKNRKTKSKAERRAETTTAIVVLLVMFLLVFLKQTVLNDQKEDVLQGASKSQSTLRESIIDSVITTNGMSNDDAACVADALIEYHGEDKLTELANNGDSDAIYTPEAENNIRNRCDIEYN